LNNYFIKYNFTKTMKLFSSVTILIFGFFGFNIALACAYERHPENSTNLIQNTCINSARQADTRVEILKAKRELSDAPILLVYVAIAAVIVIPQIPQLDI
jgi:hypothetical protein